MSSSLSVIPGMYAEGQFVARSPFNAIVDKDINFKVEAIRTISEMQIAKIDIFKILLEPVGISQDKTTEYINEFLNDKACIITLTQLNGSPVYVPSTYLESTPVVDGVAFERLCIIADCGACSPDTKTKVDSTLQLIKLAVQKNLGITSPKVQVASTPLKSYVPKAQAEAWEKSRLLKIEATYNPIIENEILSKQIEEYKTYITQLESTIKNNS